MANIQRRRTKDGEIRYKVTVRLKGAPTQTATFRRKTDADRWAGSIEAAIREGRHFKSSAARKHTLNDLIDRYIEEILPNKPLSAKNQESQLNWWRAEIGSYSLIDVTPDVLSKCRNKLLTEMGQRGKPRGPATTVRFMAALSHAFSIAQKEYQWIDHNPMTMVTKPKEPRGRTRFLSDEERVKLLAACKADADPFLYPVVLLAISTGMRRGEILGLEWGDVDLDQGRAILRDTKNGDTRVVPLVGRALEVMKAHSKVRQLATELVFPQRDKKGNWRRWLLREPFERACKKAKLENFRFHDLRHTAASYLAMNGASLAELAEILGHRTLVMVKRYAHLSEPHTKSVVESMNEKFLG